VLALYVRPYDPRHPVVCFDERPCFLLGDAVEGLAPQPGKPEKEHYAYTKHGRCCVLAAVEPLTGQRLYQVRGQRTKREYVPFLQRLARRYAGAEAIYVVQDNLNTHTVSAFYDCLPARQAHALAARFRFGYPPKGGSWLHQIELDFSALSRQCRKRRIPSQAQLAHQLYCWSHERQAQRVKIHWQFTIDQARQTLNSQYRKVNKANKCYAKTS
jgi:hypothetical protein